VIGMMERIWLVICYDCHRQDQATGSLNDNRAEEMFKMRGWVYENFVWKCPKCTMPYKSGIKHEGG